ncbi:type II toxin-antitoxin system PemK/MazF family toxin [Bacillus bombysepticus]|uniref:type II toxin-antitoxin system PemK/MazF family toxin n=1 Tax=Bacillus bombysepticus TaxID=658666 RepID=UPI003015BD26
MRRFKRGQIVKFSQSDKARYAIIIQNNTGNRFAPTLVVVECEAMGVGVGKEKVTVNNKVYGVDCHKLFTIDKARVKKIITMVDSNEMKSINQAIVDTYMQPKMRRFVFAKLGHEELLGSEQAKDRPVLLLEEFEKDGQEAALVALMTSQYNKNKLDTHIVFEKGEGGLEEKSICMFEQIKLISKKQIVREIGVCPMQRMQQTMRAFAVSVGVKKPAI